MVSHFTKPIVPFSDTSLRHNGDAHEHVAAVFTFALRHHPKQSLMRICQKGTRYNFLTADF